MCDFSEKGRKKEKNVKEQKRAKYLKIWTKMYKIWKYFEKRQVIIARNKLLEIVVFQRTRWMIPCNFCNFWSLRNLKHDPNLVIEKTVIEDKLIHVRSIKCLVYFHKLNCLWTLKTAKRYKIQLMTHHGRSKSCYYVRVVCLPEFWLQI